MTPVKNEGIAAKTVALFEELMGKPLDQIERSDSNMYKFVFCYFKIKNPKSKISFEQFIDWADDHFKEFDALALEISQNVEFVSIFTGIHSN